jgi:hypothetical protein
LTLSSSELPNTVISLAIAVKRHFDAIGQVFVVSRAPPPSPAPARSA